MNGFLRRLAARGMGIASPLRTAAGLQFAAGSAVVEASWPGTGEQAATPAVAVSATGARHQGSAPARPGFVAARFTARPDSPGASADQESTAGTMPGGRQESAGEATASAATGDPRAASFDSAPAAEPAALLPATRAAMPLREASASPVHESERDANVGGEESGAPGEETPAFAAPPPAFGTEPAELLLPPRTRPPVAGGLFAAPRSGAGSGASRQRAAAAGETTEVHVNIGRIEVTAVHEAPPPRRAAPQRPAPMSLEDYVATRQGGRR